MSAVEDFSQRKATFQLELLRAVPQGIVESALATFALFVAIRTFDLAAWQKASVVGSASLGLLLSLFLVQLIRRIGNSVNRAAALLWASSSLAFAVASMAEGRPILYLISVCLALTTAMMATPLMAQIYRKHYPDKVRGALFSYTALLRAAAAASAGWLGGWWLSRYAFPPLFMVFAVACLAMAACVLKVAPVYLRLSNRIRWFDAFGAALADRPFRKLLISWMFLGLGNLIAMAVFVEYVANPVYGFSMSAEQVGMMTTTIPMLAFIAAIVPWGRLFDRLPFYRLRIIINLIFVAGILLYFQANSLVLMMVGIALHGLAKAGGNVVWSLWVTRFADAGNAAEYMSVHTFLTGVRGMAAPALGFLIIGSFGPIAVAWVSASLIGIGTLIVLPEFMAEFQATSAP